MIKIPYEDIITKIKDNSNLNQAEIESRVKQKMDQLAGLISQEGAAHIVANELGIKIVEQTSGRLKIKEMLPGMRNIDVDGKAQQIYEVREFKRADGTPGKVGNFLLGDETGVMRIVMWGSVADELANLKQGDVVRLTNGSVRENQGRKELHLNDSSQVIVNPSDAQVGEVVARSSATRKKISELDVNDENAEIMGTIVQLFDPAFFEVCPECGRRARLKDNNYVCDTHGNVKPKYSYVFNVVLDDGTESVRIAFYKKQAEVLFEKTEKEILQYRENIALFEPVKTDYLGKIIKVVGRAKESMFSRLDFTAQLVFPNPDPEQEIKNIISEEKTDIKTTEKKAEKTVEKKEEKATDKKIGKPAEKKEEKPPDQEVPKKVSAEDDLFDDDALISLDDLDSMD